MFRRRKISTLRTLRPDYREADHGTYARHLESALQEKGDQAALNIALTGAYGTGKSSVLQHLGARFPRRVITISFSTLSGREAVIGRGTDRNGRPDSLLNLIQKEIVKQLLYREKPSRMRASRFARVHRLSKFKIALTSVLLGFVAAVTFYNFDLLSRLRPLVPANPLGEGPSLYLATGIAVAGIAAATQFLVYGRIRVRSLSAGSATLELDADSRTYFDQYLDEIIYYFEVSKIDVVFFEDLDRFRDSGIFEELRALNTVLANAEQLRRRPVRFVYAVRDSLFDDWHPDPSDTGAPSAGGSNRAKFFDLIVPLVPFITHESARDHLKELLKDVTPAVSQDLIQLVASRLPDMRLLKNIVNEHVVFSEIVFGPSGVRGLDPNRLFALVAYKNTNLADYEEIQRGNSKLDQVFKAQKRLVDANRVEVSEELAQLEDAWSLERTVASRARSLGRVLAAHLHLLLRATGRDAAVSVRTTSRTFNEREFVSPEFWMNLVTDPGSTPLSVVAQGHPRMTISRSDLAQILGDDFTELETWKTRGGGEEAARAEELRSLRTFLASPAIAQLIRRTDLKVDGKSLAELLEALDLDGLTYDLLAGGYLDEYYILYVSRFHSEFLTANAKAFELQVIATRSTDMRFPLTVDDIAGLRRELGDGFVSTEAGFNIALVNTLVTDDMLEPLFQRIGSGDAPARTFAETYLREGASVEEFAYRMAPFFPGVFKLLVNAEFRDDLDRGRAINAALEGASDELVYESSQDAAHYIDEERSRLSVLTTKLDDHDSQALAGVLEQIGLELSALDGLSANLATSVAERGLYKISADNLRAASAQPSLSLDALQRASESTFARVTRNLDEYLNLLAGSDGGEPTISPRAEISTLISALGDQESRIINTVLHRASREAHASTLDGIPEDSWPVLAQSGLMRTSVENLDRYISVHGADDALVASLSKRPEIETSDDDDLDARVRVATALVNEGAMSSSQRVSLAKKLGLKRPLDPAQVTSSSGDLTSRLVSAGLLPDEPESFALLPKGDWKGKAAYIQASKEIPRYLPEAELSPAEIESILGDERSVRPTVEAILFNLDAMTPRLTRTAWRRLAQFLADTQRDVDQSVLNTLARQRVAQGSALRLYFTGSDSADDEVLRSLLRSLGDPYDRLLQPGNSPVFLPDDEPHLLLARRLEDLEVISSASRDEARHRIRVNRHRR